MRFHMNQQTIAGADDMRLKAPESNRGMRRIDAERELRAYINANDFTEAYTEDLVEMFYDQGYVEVDE